jgi:hypothetical protein
MIAIGQLILNSPVRRRISKSDQKLQATPRGFAEHLILHLPNGKHNRAPNDNFHKMDHLISVGVRDVDASSVLGGIGDI